MKLIILYLYGWILLTMAACGTFEKATTLQPQTQYFPAKKKKIPNILIERPINTDSFKKMLLVPNTDYWLAMGSNLEYFDTVLTYEQFEQGQLIKDLSYPNPSLSENAGLNSISNNNQPFMVLNLTKVKKPGHQLYAGLSLYDPIRDEIVFQNEIKLILLWDGWTDQGTMFPLFNSLLDYLRKFQ